MKPKLGAFLRQLRVSRHLSQAQLAQKAALGRSTLAQWENGTRRPHESDLTVLLHALQTNSEQCQHALELLSAAKLDTSRKRRTSLSLAPLSAPHHIGALPHHGDLLCALRLRRRLSQSETAARLGITERTLRRWEKAEVWPSAPQIQSLCHLLGAEPAEMIILTTAVLSPLETLEPSAEKPCELVERARMVYHQWPPYILEELKELHFFRLERLAWFHACRSDAGRCALVHIYSLHAAFLSANERWSEAAFYANRALDLWPSSKAPDDLLVMAALAAARGTVYRGPRPAPRRGIELLRHWVDVTPWLDYRGWLLSDLAKYTALEGDLQTGLSLAQQAREVAATYWNWQDAAYRALDHAQILIWAEQYTQALRITENTFTVQPGESLLLEIEAFSLQGEASKAQERLDLMWPLIEDHTHSHVRTKMHRLERRLSQH